jgi:hypothetical protein
MSELDLQRTLKAIFISDQTSHQDLTLFLSHLSKVALLLVMKGAVIRQAFLSSTLFSLTPL